MSAPVPVVVEKAGAGWLAGLPASLSIDAPPTVEAIEARAKLTERLGARPLWEGYKLVAGYPRPTEGLRTSEEVRTKQQIGSVYAWMAVTRASKAVIECGGGFGVSGMYWLAGLQRSGGTLYSFEPNGDWAQAAQSNLDAIGGTYVLTQATFENSARSILRGVMADIGFIDAIHTSSFVLAQFELMKDFMGPGALILIDDINFSADMSACWRAVAHRPDVIASASLGHRVGMVELV